eukprot:NODE_144_length_3058_cov_27.366567_g133_i0.p1 GENE.NODE_144_length_3058_cov_27.366567_g133_i0~~NODE_144_length_3058_cov_27.366567_g133_i0.p1  ORF type:complete len:894 (+),score=263.37 NODE_144_length_3058_cov_27.366567_g133_i0:92-2683(+)
MTELGTSVASAAASSNPAISSTTPTDVYQQQCKLLKIKPDPSVVRLLERKGADAITELDFSNLMLSPQAFEAVMEVCKTLPRLQRLGFKGSGLKQECMPSLIDMLSQHPSIASLSLAENQNLGFAAAKLLLPLVKERKQILEVGLSGTSMAEPTKALIQKILTANCNEARTLQSQSIGADSVASPMKAARPTAAAAAATSPGDVHLIAAAGAAGESGPRDMTALNRPAPGSGAAGAAIGFMPSPANAPNPLMMDLPEQKRTNHRLKTQVLEHEERIVATLKEYLLKCDKRPKEIKERQSRGHDFIDAFRDGWKWAMPSDFNVSACISDFGLEITEEDLENAYVHYTPLKEPLHLSLKSNFQELQDLATGRRRKNTVMEELSGKVRQHGPGINVLLDIVRNFLDLMGQDGTTLEAVRSVLHETEEQIKELNEKIDRNEASRERALQDEDLQAAEEFYERSLDLQEQVIDIILFRLNNLLDRTSRVRLLDNLRRLCERADGQMNETKRLNDDMAAKIVLDMKRLRQHVAEEDEGMRYREEEFAEIMKRSNEELMNNQRQQDKIWRDITYSFRELKELGDARYKEIEAWTKEVEKHERRKVEFNAILVVAEQHLVTLQELLYDCSTCDDALRDFDEFIRRAADDITSMADLASSEGDSLALSEQKRYLGAFRRFYIQVGELHFRRTKRLEECDRMLRNTEFQIDFCRETLDPDLQRYREQLKELQLRRAEVAERVKRLEQQGDERAIQFAPHEEALRAAGFEFESPLLEMQEETAERKNKVLKTRQVFLEKDKEELVDREERELQTLITSTKAARQSGISSLVRSLNSDATNDSSPGNSPVRSSPAGPSQQPPGPRTRKGIVGGLA